jgi:hypothetical protein
MMNRKSLLALALGTVLSAVLVGLFGGGSVVAYDRYNDGCNSCHGAFTDSTSPKGSTFPSGDKHAMHRAATAMNTNCNLCHRSDDGRDPYMGSSDGTALNPGIGCTGCHPAAGLRLHHVNAGTAVCLDCHSTDPTPTPENIKPAYYSTADTGAANPCNPTATANLNENWTTNGFVGTDTDGDLLYDMADPDCSAASGSPGEVSKGATPVRVTAYDKATGALTVSYGVACQATTNHIEHGLVSAVNTYTYAGQVCSIGNTGTATFTIPSGSFFLVVSDNAAYEGSYGLRRSAGGVLSERPDDTTSAACPNPQNLATRCDP